MSGDEGLYVAGTVEPTPTEAEPQRGSGRPPGRLLAVAGLVLVAPVLALVGRCGDAHGATPMPAVETTASTTGAPTRTPVGMPTTRPATTVTARVTATRLISMTVTRTRTIVRRIPVYVTVPARAVPTCVPVRVVDDSIIKGREYVTQVRGRRCGTLLWVDSIGTTEASGRPFRAGPVELYRYRLAGSRSPVRSGVWTPVAGKWLLIGRHIPAQGVGYSGFARVDIEGRVVVLRF